MTSIVCPACGRRTGVDRPTVDRHDWTVKQRALIRHMKSGSISDQVVAIAFGVSISTIRRFEIPPTGAQIVAEHRRKAAIDLRDQGHTWAEVRAALALPSRNAACKMVRRARARAAS